jgi:DNA-binding transcriptional ArsR family regulator
MVDSYDNTFAALAHPVRRDILGRLRRGESTVTELAQCYELSLNAVSKHLMVLEKARLIRRRIEWRVHYISLDPEPLQSAAQWLEQYRQFWEQSLDGLEAYLLRKKGKPHGA